MQKFLFVYYHSENRVTNRIWKVLPNMVFPPTWREKWRRSEHGQVILDSLFARPGSAPIWGRKKGEFWDWASEQCVYFCEHDSDEVTTVARGEHFVNFPLAGIFLLLKSCFAPKQDNRRKAGQHVKILSRFNQDIPNKSQAIIPYLMPFGTKLRPLASRESVGGR